MMMMMIVSVVCSSAIFNFPSGEEDQKVGSLDFLDGELDADGGVISDRRNVYVGESIWSNLSINQLVNHSINQSINQSTVVGMITIAMIFTLSFD